MDPASSLCCRGKFRSKPWQDVVTEAKALVASGVKELNLIAGLLQLMLHVHITSAVFEHAAMFLGLPQSSFPDAEDTNQYGQDWRNGHGLAELMRDLGQINGLHWMRILYAYPSYFTDELIEEIASNPKVEHRLPTQSTTLSVSESPCSCTMLGAQA